LLKVFPPWVWASCGPRDIGGILPPSPGAVLFFFSSAPSWVELFVNTGSPWALKVFIFWFFFPVGVPLWGKGLSLRFLPKHFLVVKFTQATKRGFFLPRVPPRSPLLVVTLTWGPHSAFFQCYHPRGFLRLVFVNCGRFTCSYPPQHSFPSLWVFFHTKEGGPTSCPSITFKGVARPDPMLFFPTLDLLGGGTPRLPPTFHILNCFQF